MRLLMCYWMWTKFQIPFNSSLFTRFLVVFICDTRSSGSLHSWWLSSFDARPHTHITIFISSFSSFYLYRLFWRMELFRALDLWTAATSAAAAQFVDPSRASLPKIRCQMDTFMWPRFQLVLQTSQSLNCATASTSWVSFKAGNHFRGGWK